MKMGSQEKWTKRKWTEAEVAGLLDFIKNNRPDFFYELERLELAGGDLADEAGHELSRLATRAHPDAHHIDLIFLQMEARELLQRRLGLLEGRDLKGRWS